LVILNDRKPIILNNGAGMTVTSLSPSIATIALVEARKQVPRETQAYKASLQTGNQSEPQVLAVRGNAFGRTFLEVKEKNRLVTRLEVSVRPKVTIKLCFNLVADKSRQTIRTESEIEDIVTSLNSTYLEQTGIEFVNNKVSRLKFDKDFGSAVNHRTDDYGKPLSGHEWDLITSTRDKNSHINVYFVWKLAYSNKNAEAWGLALNRDCFISDERASVAESAQTIGHEVGHVFGIVDLTKTKRQRNPTTNKIERVLVNADNYTLGYGDFIPRHQANIMWAIAQQIAGDIK
jgi:hypothetical protein